MCSVSTAHTVHIHVYTQWHGNSQSCRTLSDKSSECPVNWNWTVYKVHGEQDMGNENGSKCPVVGSMFPHPCIYTTYTCTCIVSYQHIQYMYMYMYMYMCIYMYTTCTCIHVNYTFTNINYIIAANRNTCTSRDFWSHWREVLYPFWMYWICYGETGLECESGSWNCWSCFYWVWWLQLNVYNTSWG